MGKKVILIGGGAHAISVIDSMKHLKRYEITGILDKKEKVNTYVAGMKIIGIDEELDAFYQKGIHYAVITVGGIANAKMRRALYERCKKAGYQFPNIIDKDAIVSKDIKMGEGNYIGKGVIINAKSVLGNVCIVNTGVIMEHETCIEDFVHLAPGSVLCGNVWVKANTHIGANSTLLQNIIVEENIIVGAGSLVLKNLKANRIYYGSPVKEVSMIETRNDNC